jgi:hypothetical protein
MYQRAFDATTDGDYRELRDKRGLSRIDPLKYHGLAWDGARWLIPFRNTEGRVVNLQFYMPDSGRKVNKLNLPKLGTSLFGLDRLSGDKKRIVFLLEGAFDAIALDHHLGAKRRQTYDILAFPGAFKEQWSKFFDGRKVRCLFDNDEGGVKHAERVGRLLGESGVAAEVRVLNWPEEFPDGCDVNDLVRDYPKLNIVGWSQKNSIKVVAESNVVVYHGLEDKDDDVPIDWIWPDHLPCGTYVSFSGEGGTMKSTIALEIAARYTLGKRMPTCKKVGLPAGHVLYIHAEDGKKTVNNLFKLFGGDGSKWHRMPASLPDGEWLNILESLDKIEEIIRRYGIRLVIVDGQNSVIGATDYSTDGRARNNVTNKLMGLAQRSNICVVGIRNEDKDGRPMGPQGLADHGRGIVRAVPAGEAKGKRYFQLVFKKVSDVNPQLYPPIPYGVIDCGGNLRRIDWGKEKPKPKSLAEAVNR